ncbi:unnamed protein product [Rotaria sordida]|uniref:RRM domain-containing protein n=1 Tax=Rotaria sordida TaxID=392033 RepID=A0A818SIH9_9BILA|nr:unnamed protein product [Rotaria sordida]CAF1317384.1 unnamed protein product [Rotaria sordida]CAF1450474.1 unnamed protein product [Rotaria sordida]CAF1529955.1 unnamed protein product [Rotaria sordida]CAF1665095.1 unnamed protein product [Rotaria sordida]
MADDYDQSVESFLNQVRVGHLPYGTTTKEVSAIFEQFGTIVNLFLKRRISRDSSVFLSHPYVFIVFDKSDTVDQVMAARPFFMGDCQLFVRRCLPITRKYPYEAFLTVKKILIRTESEKNDEILPDDKTIVEYLTAAGGKIEYFERLNNKTVLVQFDDYDPVDICCLSRPHLINNQLVEIEKCSNEEQARLRIEFQQKSHSVSTELSSTSMTSDIDNRTMNINSSTPTLSIDDEITQLRSVYNKITNHLECQHEQLVASLSSEWEQTAKERIRLQRLTLDYKQEYERLTKENRQWKKSFSDSLREKPDVQDEGERKLQEACRKTEIAMGTHNELIKNTQ